MYEIYACKQILNHIIGYWNNSMHILMHLLNLILIFIYITNNL
jgi:hypothetical protein